MRNQPANTNMPVLRPIDQLMPELHQLLAEIRDTLAHKPEVCREIIRRPLCAGGTTEGRFARTLLHERRAREQLFGGDLFGEASWDIMLDLFAAHEEGHPVSISSLCIASAVPPTTALRYVAHLTERGWIERRYDPQDGRRIFAQLAAPIVEKMRAFIQDVMAARAS